MEPISQSKCRVCVRPNCNGTQHLAEGYLGCNNCGVELNDLIELLQNPTLRDENACEICDYQYTSDAANHFTSHFIDENESNILCTHCKTNVQISNESYIDVDTIIVKKYQCEMCQQVFAFCKEYKQHKLEQHGINGQFTCRDCPEVFNTINKLNYHRNRMHPRPRKSEYSCRVCDDESFKTQAERRLHENKNHRDPITNEFSCTFCGKPFTNISLLEFHLLKHTHKKRYACDICGKMFGRISHLEYHQSSHIEDKMFDCDLCADKSFKTAHSLNRHMVRMHTETPGYQCEVCGKVFKDSSDRRRHRWTHGGYEKNFECDTCGKKFFENKDLRYHKRIHLKSAAPDAKNNLTSKNNNKDLDSSS